MVVFFCFVFFHISDTELFVRQPVSLSLLLFCSPPSSNWSCSQRPSTPSSGRMTSPLFTHMTVVTSARLTHTHTHYSAQELLFTHSSFDLITTCKIIVQCEATGALHPWRLALMKRRHPPSSFNFRMALWSKQGRRWRDTSAGFCIAI